MAVDFITFCCPKDIARLYVPGKLEEIVSSHIYGFNEVHVVHQRCTGEGLHKQLPDWVLKHSSVYYPDILEEYDIEEDQPDADQFTHGPNAAHYWKWHVINHLIGAKVSTADYIVFSDCDCTITESSPVKSWVVAGIELLQMHKDVLIVSPSDGGSMAERMLPNNVRLTQNVSQQLFLIDRNRFKNIDFDIPWNWEFLAPGQPMQEYYYMLEGRLWRYMHKHNLWRAILPQTWRYWHHQW